MKINDVISHLEQIAPPSLQEGYDNAGLITGSPGWECKGVITTLDSTVEVIEEAISKGCNMVVAHHPIIFGGLKRINGKNYVEETIIRAIKHDIAIYAIHTNLDNVLSGVNGRMADQLGLANRHTVSAKSGILKKLYTFVPLQQAEGVKQALFSAGAGHIGNYDECSFGTEGTGTFRGREGTHPFAGKTGERHSEKEVKLEVIFQAYQQSAIVKSLLAAHPYEEVAYDILTLDNHHAAFGSGLIGELSEKLDEKEFLRLLKAKFRLPVVRHTALLNREIKKVALCGGAGSFLISKALAAGADVYISADIKYHEFFDANGSLLVCDIGHFESEQFTIDLLHEVLQEKFLNFAVLKTEVKTNPVHYFM